MDFEQWKLFREIEEEKSSFNEAMKCAAASSGLFAVILLSVLLLIVGLTLAIA